MNQDNVSLQVNSPAPVFSLVDIFDRPVNLAEYKKKKVLIAFFRHAGCPFCNVRVHTLQKHHADLKKKNLEMIFFFESTNKLLMSSHFHKSVSPVPIIADPEKVWYEKYGVENSKLKSAKSHITGFFQQVIEAKRKKLPVHWMAGKESIATIPAEFLVDENGIVKHLHYSRGLRDRMSIDTLIEFASK